MICLVLVTFKQQTIALKYIGDILAAKWNAWEIERALSLLQPELLKFKKDTIKFFRQIKNLIRKDSIAKKIINNLTSYKLQRIFIMDLEKQFKKDGKCKSDFCQYFREIGSLDEEPIFIERYYLKFLFGSNFFFFF